MTYAWKSLDDKGTRFSILCEVPPHKRTISNRVKNRHENEHVPRVQKFPRLLFSCIVTRWADDYAVRSIQIYELRRPLSAYLTKKTSLRAAPLPNVHSNGTVCMGFVSPPVDITPLSVTEKAVNNYFTTRFNDDLLSWNWLRKRRNRKKLEKTIIDFRKFLPIIDQERVHAKANR